MAAKTAKRITIIFYLVPFAFSKLAWSLTTTEQDAQCTGYAARVLEVCKDAGGVPTNCAFRALSDRNSCIENREKHNEKFKEKALPEPDSPKNNWGSSGGHTGGIR